MFRGSGRIRVWGGFGTGQQTFHEEVESDAAVYHVPDTIVGTVHPVLPFLSEIQQRNLELGK